MPDHLTLSELGIDNDDPDLDDDPGCAWHPRSDKSEARDEHGNLADLDDDQVAEHVEKLEADEQYDGARRRRREARALGAAEDSDHSPDGAV